MLSFAVMGTAMVLGVVSVVLAVAFGIAFLGLSKERSARRTIEASLRVLRKAVDTLPMEVTVKTLDGRILYSNPAGRELHGYELEELIGRPAALPASAALARSVSPKGALALAGEGPRESVDLHRDGSSGPVELRSSVVHADDGEPLVVVTTAPEAGERQEHEQESRRLRSALENAFEGIARVGEDHRLRSANRALGDLLGCRPEEIEGKLDRELFFAPDAPALDQGISQLDRAGKAWIEARFRRADGIVFRGEALLIRPQGKGGGREHFLFIRDVSARAAREEALRTSEARFRLLAEERGEALRRLGEELERFGGEASHDLAEPLRKIRFHGERLREQHGSLLPKEGAERLERILSATVRMQRLVLEVFESRVASPFPKLPRLAGGPE